MAGKDKKPEKVLFDEYRLGIDELNLAEFPLAGIADRFLDGRKTVVFKDQVWDPERRLHIPRELAISGSDRYGLPTATDDDVLLACMQLAHMDGFSSREVAFSRYGLLKLLRWPDEGKYYKRLFLALRRWKGVTIYSSRAFYDHKNKSWINRDFGIFDNLYVYEREESSESEKQSWFVWNEVVLESIQSGYVKSLDWDLYCRLQDPVAKRLYRLLDKRFYRADRLVLDLHDLGVQKVRLSENYNTAQIKRALMNGIRELEALWDLKQAEPEERFRKISAGKWEAIFERKAKGSRGGKKFRVSATSQASPLCESLTARGVSAQVAEKLVAEHPAERITRTVELFDWHANRGDKKGPGFLVAGIRSADGFAPPPNVQVKDEKVAPTKANAKPRRDHATQRAEEKQRAQDQAMMERIEVYRSSLSIEQSKLLEKDALANANPFFLKQLDRSQATPEIAAQYLKLIVDSHIHRLLEQSQNATKQ